MLGFARDEILQRLRYLKPASSFRSAYAYSNFGLTEGGVAAARAAGLTWEDAADQYLYKRLGMASTSSRHTRLSRPHQSRRASCPPRRAMDGIGARREPDAQSPAGGVSSTARDLAQWMRLELANGKYQGEPLIQRGGDRPDACAADGAGQSSALRNAILLRPGLERRVSAATALSGVMPGPSARAPAHSSVSFPSQQLGIVVLTNAFPTGVPEGIADTFLVNLLGGDAGRDWVGEWNRAVRILFGPAVEEAKATYGHPPANALAVLLTCRPMSALTPTTTWARYRSSRRERGLALKLGPERGALVRAHAFRP